MKANHNWLYPALLCLGLSAAVVVPFFLMAKPPLAGTEQTLLVPATHDMAGHFEHMRDFYQGLAAGEIYPRWEEDTNRGFGSPTTCFYPPGIYYVTSAFYLLLGSWTRALLGTELLLMIASAAAIYWCARQVISRGAAAVAMAVYLVLPYHLADLYQRGALAELLGFVWMPLILGFTERLFQDRPSRPLLSLAGLAASYGAFLWSHPPTAYQFTLAFGLCLPLAALLRKNWRGLLRVAGGMALGIALSAAYLYPAAIEQRFIRHEVIDALWPYDHSYLFTHTWQDPAFFDVLNAAWLLGTGSIVFCAATLLLIRPRRLGPVVAFWATLGLFAAFMMTSASAPLGRRIPMISIGVFSWRMLVITTLVAALLTGAAAEAAWRAWRERHTTNMALFVQPVILALAGGLALSVLMVVAPARDSEAFEPMREHLNYVTIPHTALARPDQLPVRPPAALDGASGSVAVREWKPEHRVILVRTGEPDQLRIRTFLYPGWTAALDGRPAPLKLAVATGGILLDIPAGAHQVNLDFRATPTRRAGAWITRVAFLVLLALTAVGRVRSLRRPIALASAAGRNLS